ncbi:MAG: helix-turn-helix domain-containing protein [Desulforhopalus sp.]
MSLQTMDMEHISLGEFLRDARDKRGLDLNAIAHETKISMKNLRAVESSDFSSLPAEAFTRGIYTLYAKALSLDPEHVLKRYTEEKPAKIKSGDRIPIKNDQPQDVGHMASRPSSLPLAIVGLALFFLLLAGGFLCWYFSWNPATYLSQKLRGLQDPIPNLEQAIKSEDIPFVPDPLSYFPSTGRKNTTRYLFSLPAPSSATAAVSGPMVYLDDDAERGLDPPITPALNTPR